jgi:hypothetical protein
MTELGDIAEQKFEQTNVSGMPANKGESAPGEGPTDHCIPLRKQQLVRLLVEDTSLHNGDVRQFEQLCRLLTATIHYQYHECLEALKDLYAPFNPDAVTWEPKTLTEEQCRALIPTLFDRFMAMSERANYRRLSRAEIDQAIGVASDWGVRLHVDFTVFERLEVYVRGDVIDRRTRRSWRTRYQPEMVDVPIYERLVVIFQLRHKQLSHNWASPIPVYIKVFKNIPKADLDMLLPGTRFAMSMLDRGKIILPTITGISIAVLKIVKGALLLAFAGVYGILAVLGLVGGTVGYGVKSFLGYLRTKEKYQLNLTRSLYYQNLDNNAGVIFRILDEAEEQELVESLLAYALLLWKAPETGWTAEQLDQEAERYLSAVMHRNVDFEVHDALDKLDRFGCVCTTTDNRWHAKPIETVLRDLDRAWDNYFLYNHNGDAHDGSPRGQTDGD